MKGFKTLKMQVLYYVKILTLFALFGCATTLQDVRKWESDAAVSKLIAVLERGENSTEVRVAAAEALGRLDSKPAIEPLSVALKDKDSRVRGATARALLEIDAVEACVALLKDGEVHVRKAAVGRLAELGNATDIEQQAIKALFVASEDKDFDVRSAATRALLKTDKVEVCAALLKGGEAIFHTAAVAKLGQIGGQQAIKELLVALKHTDSDVRLATAIELGKIGDEKTGRILIETVNADGSALVRKAAVEALGEINDNRFALTFVEALKDESDLVRKATSKVLVKIGSPVVPALIESLKEASVKETAGEVLVKIGQPAIPSLIEAIEDQSVQKITGEILVRIGQPAMPVFIEALKDQSYAVRETAVEGLARIGQPAVPLFLELLRNRDDSIRKTVVEILVRFSESALVETLTHHSFSMSDCSVLVAIGPTATPLLNEVLRHQSRLIRLNAAKALEKLGWEPENQTEQIQYLFAKEDWDSLVKIGQPAVSLLIEVLKNEDYEIRLAATKSLGKIGNKRAIKPLSEVLKDEDYEIRLAAIKSLKKIDNTETVPHIIEVLKDEHGWVQKTAIEVLGEIGDKRAVPVLIKMLTNESEFVLLRSEAAVSLGKIGDERAVPSLVETLKDKKLPVRRRSAEALDRLKWKPQNQPEKRQYIYAKEEREKLSQIGRPLEVLFEVFVERVRQPVLDNNGGFWVYKDGMTLTGRGIMPIAPHGIPYSPYGWMPKQATNMIEMDLEHENNPHAGDMCIAVTVNWLTPYWCGVAFISGPSDNMVDGPWWGKAPRGWYYNLSGLKKMRFVVHMRGENGGERVQWKIGPLARDENGQITKYGDSLISPVQTNWITLTNEWKRYELDLRGYNLWRVCSLCFMLAKDRQTHDGPITFYIDTVYFE